MPALLGILMLLIFLRVLLKLPGVLRGPLNFDGCLFSALPFVLIMLVLSVLLF
jgi:hypothetical protein